MENAYVMNSTLVSLVKTESAKTTAPIMALVIAASSANARKDSQATIVVFTCALINAPRMENVLIKVACAIKVI